MGPNADHVAALPMFLFGSPNWLAGVKATFHSESVRDANDHVKIIEGIGTCKSYSIGSTSAVCKLRNRVDRLRARDGGGVDGVAIHS